MGGIGLNDPGASEQMGGEGSRSLREEIPPSPGDSESKDISDPEAYPAMHSRSSSGPARSPALANEVIASGDAKEDAGLCAQVADGPHAGAWGAPGRREGSLAARLSNEARITAEPPRPARPSLAAASTVNIRQRKLMLMDALGAASGAPPRRSSAKSSLVSTQQEQVVDANGGEQQLIIRRHRPTLLEDDLVVEEPHSPDSSADPFASLAGGRAAMTPGITGRINQRLRELQNVVQNVQSEGSLSPYVLTSGAYEVRASSSPSLEESVSPVATLQCFLEAPAGDTRVSHITSRRTTRASMRMTGEFRASLPPVPSEESTHPTFGARVVSAFGRSVYGEFCASPQKRKSAWYYEYHHVGVCCGMRAWG